MRTLVDVLQRTEAHFRERGIPSARLDAELIVAHALGMDRLRLYLEHDRPLSERELGPLRELVRRRARREPLAWIVGKKEFREHEFALRPGVLVPRPDTETLVLAALELLPAQEESFVADVGCGSGCIGLSLAAARPGVKVYATDVSAEALDCTKQNVARMDLGSRVAVLRGEWLTPIPATRPIDLVVSNPPYIASPDLEGLAPEVRDHEPRTALDGGPDGLAAYRALVPAAAARARRAVLVEVGAGQAPVVAAMFEAAGLRDVRTRRDLGGIERVVVGLE